MIDVVFTANMEAKPYRKGAAIIPSKGGGKPHAAVFTDSATKKWQERFAAIASEYAPEQLIDEPVRVDVLAIMPRPQRLMRKVDPAGFPWGPGKPDADNVRKNVLDALRSWWRDDSLVVAGQTVRVHAEKTGLARIVVRVRTLENVLPMSIIGPVFGADVEHLIAPEAVQGALTLTPPDAVAGDDADDFESLLEEAQAS
jgi:Holliday junction resolvase RusA-like endonuclease